MLIRLLKAIWAYRDFIGGMVRREFASRYTRSLLGGVWAVLDPLSMILIYTLIFSRVMRSRLPGSTDSWNYSIYICVGVIAWEYFTEVINRSQGMFLDNSNLLKKMSFPRSTLPVVLLLSATINFSIIAGLFCLFLIVVGRFPGWPVLAMVPLLLMQQGIAVGLGLLLGTLNAFFRDVGQTMGVCLRFWFWLTPIVYPNSVLPERIRHLMFTWNPMARLVVAYQDIFIKGTVPRFALFIPQMFLAMALLGAGFYVFTRLAGEMVDEL